MPSTRHFIQPIVPSKCRGLSAFYSLMGNNLADAAIIDCRNGMFGKSCIRQGLSRTAYLGLGKSAPYRKQPKPGETHVEPAGDNYELSIENSAETQDPVSLWNSGIKGAASALTLRGQGKPFTATLPVQMLYETLLPESNRARGKISSRTVLELLAKMPPDRRMRCLESFGDKYGYRPMHNGSESTSSRPNYRRYCKRAA